jgi:hypothetical protein
MRRGLIVFAVLALALVAALWVAARIERSPLARSAGVPQVPEVIAGRDFGPLDAPAPVRADISADTAIVRCAFVGEGEPGTLSAIGPSLVEGDADGLALSLPPGTWNVVWTRAPEEEDWTTTSLGTLTLAAGDVKTCTLGDGGFAIRGAVRNPDGRAVAGAEVWGCGSTAYSDEDGSFRLDGRAGECEVWAAWRDGLLSRRSARVAVGPFEERAVELVVDDAPIAGMGLAFRVTEEGVRVLGVHSGTPADEAGVLEGDLIVSIDGTPTAGLDENAFIALGTGAEGSRVELVLEQDGARETVSFLRERLADREDDEAERPGR